MSIKIETEKTVYRGEICRKIGKISGCKKQNDLPMKYINGDMYIYSSYNNAITIVAAFEDFPKGYDNCWVTGNQYKWTIGMEKLMPEDQFQIALKLITKCSHLLQDINSEIRKTEASWNGSETFII